MIIDFQTIFKIPLSYPLQKQQWLKYCRGYWPRHEEAKAGEFIFSKHLRTTHFFLPIYFSASEAAIFSTLDWVFILMMMLTTIPVMKKAGPRQHLVLSPAYTNCLSTIVLFLARQALYQGHVLSDKFDPVVSCFHIH
jgi:hypothetical protein